MQSSEQQVKSIKSASVDFAEGALFGSVLWGSEELDAHLGLNSDEFKSFGTGIPLATATIGVVGASMTSGRDHELFSDLIFMSTPFAVYRLLRMAKAKKLFGKTFNFRGSTNKTASNPPTKQFIPPTTTVESSLV